MSHKVKSNSKIKYYDRLLSLFIICILWISIVAYFLPLNGGILPNVILIPFILCIIFQIMFIVGMMYNMVKSKHRGDFVASILLLPLSFIIAIVFYFTKMRKEFKKIN
jgi:hypothetical protein